MSGTAVKQLPARAGLASPPRPRGESRYRLVRTPVETTPRFPLDTDQRAVADHAAGPLLVLAGPGTGKTTTIVESVVARVEAGADPESVLVLTYGRKAAGRLRERITARLGRTTTEPLARTFHSYAWGLLRRDAALRSERAPRLLTGPEQDALIRELLEGDVEGIGVHWPDPEQLQAPRGFAAELRDLMLRTLERGIDPVGLDDLGTQQARDDWRAAARFLQQYFDVLELRNNETTASGVAYDSALIIQEAVSLLRNDPELLDQERRARRYVFVDEYQETDPAQRELLRLLCDGGRFLVAAGDPDQSIFSFRGADPGGVHSFVDDFPTTDGEPAPTIVLGTAHRAGPVLQEAADRIGTRLRGGRKQRTPHLGPETPPSLADGVEVVVVRSATQEAAYVAHRLRRAHLIDGVPWSRMAVLVRSAPRSAGTLRRGLVQAGVPVEIDTDELPLAQQRGVAPIVKALGVALHPERLDDAAAVGLLTSPLGDADALSLRRLRQQLRLVASAGGDTRSSAELLPEALADSRDLIPVDAEWGRPARRVAAVLQAIRDAAAAPGASPESVLWAAWETSGLGPRWEDESLRGGAEGADADAALDAAVALFDQAAKFVDGLPGATPTMFVDYLEHLRIPADSIAPTGQRSEVVRILTAHAAKGLEWDVVAVAGVQEGLWPDLRPRGTVLGSEELVDLVAGRPPQLTGHLSALLDEERRLFYVAVTRARRALLVTAVDTVDGEDAEQASRFLDEIDPPEQPLTPRESDGGRPQAVVPRQLTLPALVAELRRAVLDREGDPVRRRAAARRLARLADEGVPGADPAEWWGFAALSDAAALRGPDEMVAVSPSRVEAFQTCALRWLLETSGGGTTSTAQGIGTVVHDVAAEVTAEQAVPDLRALSDRLNERWRRVDLTGWYGRKQHERANQMVERLADWLAKNPRQLVAVEREFSVDVGRATVRGRVDRLERDEEGRLVVVDLKTGQSKPSAENIPTHPQLGVYQLAVEQGAFGEHGTESGGASLVHIGMPTRRASEQVQEPPRRNWAERLVRDVADGMAGSVFEATQNNYCRMCAVSASCPIVSGQVTDE
ncbi:ATP-dependent helicase [Cryptosporangium aurantiacum]|uniref:DNA 3'-5' helicase n=1 Tax=Cryptosporangium aurantiacum TaxID=134849 RepID=A0A1M7QPD6_9ACTN|nr:ATP-dependent DNA helicase [Cryptosporangium aurantiacum]SHN33016.1 Superfamily I DNA or RNA helicase [Cryptosporangium aurantiacum]